MYINDFPQEGGSLSKHVEDIINMLNVKQFPYKPGQALMVPGV
jgi:hypothetical protein